jgi:hypothetical protein
MIISDKSFFIAPLSHKGERDIRKNFWQALYDL